MDRYLLVPLSSVTPVTVDVGETVPPPVSRTLLTWHAASTIDTMTIPEKRDIRIFYPSFYYFRLFL